MKPLTLVLGLFAAALLALGLLLGFRGITDANGYDCGSAFRESPDLYSDQLVNTMGGGDGVTGCDKERSDALPLPLTLLVLGAATGVAAVVVGASSRERRSTPVAP